MSAATWPLDLLLLAVGATAHWWVPRALDAYARRVEERYRSD